MKYIMRHTPTWVQFGNSKQRFSDKMAIEVLKDLRAEGIL